MARLAQHLDALRASGKKALVTFVTAGDPSLEDLPTILYGLQEAGADVIELGIPFSDPIADGPTIQASSQRALDRGVTPAAVLEALDEVQLRIPVVLMGYFNPVLRMGLDAFAARASAAGASGVLMTDLTPEESDAWLAASAAEDLDSVFLVAPTSTEPRIIASCARATGFVYAVSRTGVTGTDQHQMSDAAAGLVQRIRPHTSRPIYLGFGIGTPEAAGAAARIADGVIVGSALVQRLSQGPIQFDETFSWVQSLKKYLDSAENC